MKIKLSELKQIIRDIVVEASVATVKDRQRSPAMFNLWQRELTDKLADAGYEEVEYAPLFATSHDLRTNDVLRRLYTRGMSPRQAIEMLEDPRKFYDNVGK